jgi:hypothetical protein
LEEAAMKEIEIDDKIRSNASLLADVQRVTRLLEDEIGSAAFDIKAEWRSRGSRHPDYPEVLVELTISDDQDHSSVVFSQDGLASMSLDMIRVLLIRLWGDILQERSDRQIKKLMNLVNAMQEG